MDLQKKTALITGGSAGIGYGIAAALLREGMNVAITSRSQNRADEAAKALSGSGGGEVIGISADVRDLKAQQEAVKRVVDTWGQLDLLVANAGVGYFGSIEDLTPEQWQETLDTNLTGPFNSIKAGAEALKSSKGYYITISSLAGTNFFPGGAAYNASKFGLTGFTQAVMLDLRNYGIRVTTIMPGSVSTKFNKHQPGDQDSWKIQIEDIGEMVVSLMKLNHRTLPSKIEVRPTQPPKK
jgi:3-oxoacyl-[acyl-carrier protein] reductase